MSGSLKIPTPDPNLRRDIQGLRALAVVLVIAFHLGLPASGGFIGVDIFFVISGYVISAMLEREWNTNQKISIKNFFVRRFWRLTPALALVVSVTFLFGTCILSAFGPSKLMVITGVGAMTLTANAVIAKFTGGYFDLAADTNPLLNTWSLSVEEQFYIGFLFILIFGWLIGKVLGSPKVGVLISVGSVFLLSATIAMLSQPGYALEGSNWLFNFYSPLNRAWEFAAGAILALAPMRQFRSVNRYSGLIAILGLGLVLYSVAIISEDQAWPSLITVLPVFATLLLIWSCHDQNGFIYRVLSNKFAVYLGDRSYSLYLWHWPLIVILGYFNISNQWRVLLVLVLTLIFSMASYRWVESTLRKKRPNRKSISTVLAISIVCTPLSLAAGAYKANQNSFWNQNLANQKIALAKRHAADKDGCNKKISYLHRSASKCSWNTNLTGAPIYLVGDSNAAHYSDGFIAAANQTNHPLITAVGSGCPFLLTEYEQPDRRSSSDGNYHVCSSFFQETFTWLKTQPRGLVVISNSESYQTVSDLRVIPKASSAPGNLYPKLLNETVQKLSSEGFRVAIISGPPHFDARATGFPVELEWDPARCTLLSQLRGECDRVMSVKVANELQSDIHREYEKISQSTNAKIIDISRFFCIDGNCPTQSGNLQIYRDRQHTTYDADLKLVPIFAKHIKEIFSSK